MEHASALISHDGPAVKLQREMSTVNLGGFYVLPPLHLMVIETKGIVQAQYVFSADGDESFCPYQDVTRDDLRVLAAHLADFEARLVQLNGNSAPPASKARDQRLSSVVEERLDDMAIEIEAVIGTLPNGWDTAPRDVMLALQARAGSSRSCVKQALAGAVIWRRSTGGGDEKLDTRALSRRLRTRRTKMRR